MKRLTVLYDASCGFCIGCRHWLERQPKLIALAFVPCQSAEARSRFPKLAERAEELVVVSDDGGVYRGAKAFLMCLYALEDYREWSLRLAQPALLPIARRAFEQLSHNRKDLSRWLGLAVAGKNAGSAVPRATCAAGDCER
jgi:predicted DCC family thiol-disulfide oxidoreductase YuxK